MIFRPLQLFLNLIVTLVLCVSALVDVKAQLSDGHLAISYNLDYFTNLGDLKTNAPRMGFEIRGGMNLFLTEERNMKLGFEVGYSDREIVQSLGNTDYKFKFRSIDMAPVYTLEVYNSLYFEAVLGVSLFDIVIYEDGDFIAKGNGFVNYDIYVAGGINYSIHRRVDIGTRVRYGFIPSLKYKPITDYGEIKDETRVINQLSFGLYVRFKFYVRDEE